MAIDTDEELKESLANILTGGVHYYELEDDVHRDDAMAPSFQRWSSDVIEEIDEIVKLFKSLNHSNVTETTRTPGDDDWKENKLKEKK